MRRALAAIPALTAAISTFGAIWAPRSEAVCAAQVIWHGRIYIGYNGESGPEAGPALADKATLPRCDDVIINGSPRREPDTPITVHAIPDVDPIIAVVHAEAAIVYVNASTFVALPSHPLHRF